MRGKTCLLVFVLNGVLLPNAIHAQEGGDKDPIIKPTGKKASEWIKILQTSKMAKERRKALIALRIGGPEIRGVFPALTAALAKDADKGVRITAARTIGAVAVAARRLPDKPVEVTKPIAALVNAVATDKVPDVRVAASSALSDLVDFDPDPKKVRDPLLRAELKAVVPVLAKTLTSGLNHDAPEVQAAIADTLARMTIDAAPAIDELKKALAITKGTAKNKQLARRAVILAIGRVGAPESLGAIEALLGILREKDVDPTVRSQVAQTFGQMKEGAAAASAALAKLLADPNVEVRREAASAIDEIGDGAKDALPALLKTIVLTREDKFVRCHLVHGLGEIGRICTDNGQRITALQALGKLTVDVDDDVRLTALHALGTFAPTVARDFLKGFTPDPSALVRETSTFLAVLNELATARTKLVACTSDLKMEIRTAAESSLKLFDAALVEESSDE